MVTTGRNFGCKIPDDLKDRIDSQVENTRLPMGRIVEALAQFWAGLSEEEQKHLCYGTNQLSLTEFIDARLRAILNESQPDSEAQPSKPLHIKKSIQDVAHSVKYKLLSAEEQKELRALYRELRSEFPTNNKKTKKKKKTRKKSAS